MKSPTKAWFEETGDLVVIHAPDSATGVPLEYEYLEQRFGQRDGDWNFVCQRLMPRAPDGWLDLVEIELADGTRHEARFDITQFCFLSGGDIESDDDEDDAPTIGEIIGRK